MSANSNVPSLQHFTAGGVEGGQSSAPLVYEAAESTDGLKARILFSAEGDNLRVAFDWELPGITGVMRSEALLSLVAVEASAASPLR